MTFARIAAVLAALIVATAAPAWAQQKPALPDVALGRPDAPLTVIEYSSLGCGHCAAFHADVLPQIRKRYIDTGKVRWIMRDFPLNQLALAGAVTARCAGPGAHVAVMESLFRTQETWMTGADPIAALERTARQAGVAKARFDACLSDNALIAGILDHAQNLSKSKTVTATPTFLVGEERVVGMRPFDEMAVILDRHLKAAPAKP